MIKIFMIVLLIVWVLAGIVLLIQSNYFVHRDTTAWLNRAQVAADAEDMNKYLVHAEKGLTKWGLKSGYAAFVFTTPDNNMGLISKALERATARANQLISLPKISAEYQIGLDDLRGTIRELDLCAEYRYCIEHPNWFWFSALFGWLPLAIYGCYLFYKDLTTW